MALLALSLAPVASHTEPQPEPALAAETMPEEELPWLASEVPLDAALDLGLE